MGREVVGGGVGEEVASEEGVESDLLGWGTLLGLWAGFREL